MTTLIVASKASRAGYRAFRPSHKKQIALQRGKDFGLSPKTLLPPEM
jgi:hypothetical protein